MGVIYKLSFEGTCQGQNITNLLYYAQDDGSVFGAYYEPTALDILDAAAETFVENYLAALPLSYTLNLLRVTSIDERGVVNSPYDLIQTIGEAGVQGGGITGAFNCAILPITTAPSPDGQRNLKRSYLAYGPITEVFTNDDQTLTAGALTAIAPFSIDVGQLLVGAITAYAPVRVGRTQDPAPIAIGVVRSVSIAAYSSVRKSRKKTPRGT